MMIQLIAGLLLFLGIHSTGIFAPAWREKMQASLGVNGWKAIYSVVSIVGFLMIIWGYGSTRMDPFWIWFPPVWARHLALLLTVPAFVLLAATYVPGSNIKARLGHPMLAAVKIWALAHLLANGSLADMLLFGSFLTWAVTGFVVLRRRDRAAGVVRSGNMRGDLIAVVTGLIMWALFTFYLHTLLIGVRPLP
jgi:uncharacterized membrane protein